MPVVANEAADYGYEAEDRGGTATASCQSAEQERTLAYRPKGWTRFVPDVARGK